MGDTPEDGLDPLPVSGVRRAEDRPARTREPGRPAARAEATARPAASSHIGIGRIGIRRIGIRELRQHASIYVDLAEKGYTVDITNRGRLVAQLVPVTEPGSPLERLIAAGIIEAAEEPGGADGLEPYPAPPAGQPNASEILGRLREAGG
jgi:antitoxin (DNA-binding transcriptional repressor) of toxin-antitoxin stability system